MNEDENQVVQVVRSEVCSSVSGRTMVSYDIGTSGDRQFIRLDRSDNGGLCCREWIDLAVVKKLLSGNPSLTSSILKPLYQNKSSNSPSFLFAALVNEKMCVVKPSAPAPKSLPAKPAKSKKNKNDEAPLC